MQGDVRARLRDLPDACVRTCVTSPPYFGLRDYGVAGQMGLEKTPEEYVAALVDVFREVRRVLSDDGTLWLNLGDSYWSDSLARETPIESMWGKRPASDLSAGRDALPAHNRRGGLGQRPVGVKPKDLLGMPWRVALALQSDGWYLRQDIIWHKPNPMPEAVKDRCTKAHEYIFLLSKQERYYFDSAAMQEPSVGKWNSKKGFGGTGKKSEGDPMLRTQGAGSFHADEEKSGRNRRSVWSVTVKPFKGAHFATFPPDLITPCVLAGSAPGDTVLDPFNGSGTTGIVATQHGRRYVGIELNPDYIGITHARFKQAAP